MKRVIIFLLILWLCVPVLGAVAVTEDNLNYVCRVTAEPHYYRNEAILLKIISDPYIPRDASITILIYYHNGTLARTIEYGIKANDRTEHTVNCGRLDPGDDSQGQIFGYDVVWDFGDDTVQKSDSFRVLQRPIEYTFRFSHRGERLTLTSDSGKNWTVEVYMQRGLTTETIYSADNIVGRWDYDVNPAGATSCLVIVRDAYGIECSEPYNRVDANGHSYHRWIYQAGGDTSTQYIIVAIIGAAIILGLFIYLRRRKLKQQVQEAETHAPVAQ
jgi:LPXTG-motif cell wall-anchored protein